MTTARNFAIDIEQGEQRILKEIAQATDKPGVRGALGHIMEDEKETITQLANICAMGNESACVQTNALDSFKTSVLSGIEPRKIAEQLDDSLDTYRFVMKLEKDVEELYRTVAEQVQDDTIRNAINSVLDIKHHEMQDVEYMYLNANAPNENLEWGEFSNIDEFHQFGRDLY